MRFDILTLFPAMFAGPIGSSILKRGMQAGLVGVRLHDIRDYATDRHRTVDDYPYGGGAGMVMKPEPLARAIEAALALPLPPPGLRVVHPEQPDEVIVEGPETEAMSYELRATSFDKDGAGVAVPTSKPPVILMSPAGRVLTQGMAAEMAAMERAVLVCGHYEGIDERVREQLIDQELSIGDYVLTGGELAAMVVVDAVARLLPGVLAEDSPAEESHTSGLLEYPQYTRPAEFRGQPIPPILISGHHANVALWRRREALRRTFQRRPDMLERAELSKQDLKWLAELRAELDGAASQDRSAEG